MSKGCKDLRDVRLRADEYKIPYKNFIAVGDGFTDKALWMSVKKKGGKCVIVYERGSMESYKKAMTIAWTAASYVLEQDYTPEKTNPTWVYLNECIHDIVNRQCKHSDVSIDHLKWGKITDDDERVALEKHILKCKEHSFGNTITHVVPKHFN